MNIAQRLPALHLPQLPTAKVAGLWQKHHWAVVALWLAFMAGLMGADMWFTKRIEHPLPEAALEVGPMPLPLVAGVDPVDQPLVPAPAPGLEVVTPEGKLPIAAGTRTPLEVYAYPFDRSEARPRISIVLTDAGPQANLTGQAIRKLPGSVALAFNPYTPGIGTAMASARQSGHETLLMIPADNTSPGYDPGPGALRLSLSERDNLQRLHILMGKASGYVGLMVNPETALLHISGMPRALLGEARVRGLALLSDNQDLTDIGLNDGSPTAQITMALDGTLTPEAFEDRLAELEQRARETGHVVATTAIYPFVITELAKWLPTLANKGIAIAPVSAAANPVRPDEAAPATPQQHSSPANHSSAHTPPAASH